MKTEYLSFDNSGKGKHIEKISKVFPYIGISILSKTLIVETIDLSDLSGLMITSEYGKSFLKSDFQANK